jgi:hypothetical protein
VTGKGNVGKAEVIVAMRALGHPVIDANEADALALLHWVMAHSPERIVDTEVHRG